MATPREIALAARVLAAGGLVAFPTETVYGLGADALNPEAVGAIFQLKGRPVGHPLIVHLPVPRWPVAATYRELLQDWAANVPDVAVRLAEVFWPGPLTLILQRSRQVPDAVTGGLETVGLRVPGHPVAQQLLAEMTSRGAGRGGIAAPSANRFGCISPTRIEHVVEEFGEALLLAEDLHKALPLPPGIMGVILDGGESAVGIESTIVDLSGDWLRVLRPGSIALPELHRVLEHSPDNNFHLHTALGSGQVRVPGMLSQHYAPKAELRLLRDDQLPGLLEGELQLERDRVPVGIIAASSSLSGKHLPIGFIGFPLGESTADQAHNLYAVMRQADQVTRLIYAVLPPPVGIGIAIRDRLRRAAGLGGENEVDAI